MAKVYHYTDEEGASGIMDSRHIGSNKGLRGKGVYFTSLGPRTNSDRLIENNYDGMRGNWDDKIDYWFSFFVDDFNEGELERLNIPNRDIWVIRRGVNLSETSVPNWTNFGEDSESDSDQCNKTKIYHYTNENRAHVIKNSGHIACHKGFRGNGVYFTSLGPRTNMNRLIQNYDGLLNKWSGKTYWFSFYVDDFDDGELQRLKIPNRDIWMIRRGVNLKETSVPNSTSIL